MSLASQPWMKFYPQDWRADEKLRLCSLSARGLWIEMLAIMHRSERYGFLLIAGTVPTEAQLAVQVGASPQEVSDLIAELRSAGVFSCAAKGVIYSRRMTRDVRKSKAASKNGKIGGDVSAGKRSGKSGSPERISSQGSTPEARSQSSDTNVSGVPPVDPVKVIFDLGLSLLTDAGQSPSQARSILGMWRKKASDGAVIEGLIDARARSISNPVEWLQRRFDNAKPDSTIDAVLKRYAA